MRRNKLKTKMTITVAFKEAKKKGIDNIEELVTKEFHEYAIEKNWKDYEIIFDAKDDNLIYIVKEAK